MYDEINDILNRHDYYGTWGTDFHDARTFLFIWPDGAAAIQWKDDKSDLTDTEKAFRNAMVNNGMNWGLARSLDDVENYLVSLGAI